MIREISVQEALNDPTLLAQWRELVARSGNIGVMYQSPDWVAHLVRDKGAGNNIRLLVDTTTPSPCIAASLKGTVNLGLSTRHIPGVRNIMLADRVMGNGFLGNEASEQEQQYLLDSLLTCGAQALHFRMLPHDSQLFRTVKEMARTRPDIGLCVLSPTTIRHVLNLPSSFDGYLNTQFDSKSRYNLRRQARLISEKTGQPLSLRVFSSVSDVPSFLADAALIAARSWQKRACGDILQNTDTWMTEFDSLASRGLFRSYILYAGGTPLSFAVGIPYRDVFHFDTTAYDQQWRALSPGIVMLHLLIQDLITLQPGLKRISFGYGDHDYKRMFSNQHIPVAEVLLYWKTAANRKIISLYKIFKLGTSLARKGRALAGRRNRVSRPPS